MNQQWKNEINLRYLFERISLINGDVNVVVAPPSVLPGSISEIREKTLLCETIINSERVIEDLHNSSEDRFASSVHKFYPGLFDLFASGQDLVVLLETDLENDYKYIIPLRVRPRAGITNQEVFVDDGDTVILGKFDFVC